MRGISEVIELFTDYRFSEARSSFNARPTFFSSGQEPPPSCRQPPPPPQQQQLPQQQPQQQKQQQKQQQQKQQQPQQRKQQQPQQQKQPQQQEQKQQQQQQQQKFGSSRGCKIDSPKGEQPGGASSATDRTVQVAQDQKRLATVNRVKESLKLIKTGQNTVSKALAPEATAAGRQQSNQQVCPVLLNKNTFVSYFAELL